MGLNPKRPSNEDSNPRQSSAISVMTSIIEDAEASYHKPVILHCAFCVLMTRFQLFFFSIIVLQLLLL